MLSKSLATEQCGPHLFCVAVFSGGCMWHAWTWQPCHCDIQSKRCYYNGSARLSISGLMW